MIQHISKTAKIGKGTKIWHFAYVGSESKIGSNCKIGSLTHIDYDVVIHDNTVIEGMVYIPPRTRIGSNVFIGPGVVFTNDPYPPSKKLTGAIVENGAIISAGAVIKAGIVIGEKSFVAMGAVVTKSVPPCECVKGIPAKKYSTRAEYIAKKSNWENESIFDKT